MNQKIKQEKKNSPVSLRYRLAYCVLFSGNGFVGIDPLCHFRNSRLQMVLRIMPSWLIYIKPKKLLS